MSGNSVQRGFHGKVLELVEGDICDQEVDAIVNAANSRLAGGGGVDGAIHARGGPAIMDETRRKFPEGCPTGSAVITGAGNLSAKFVIHAVGPVWHGGARHEGELLSAAYARSLELAAEHTCSSIAFPALSAGAYRYPLKEATTVALESAIAFLRNHDQPHIVRFVLFGSDAFRTFADVLHTVDG